MNIECINCSKTFEVNSDLIPSEGRNLQCGSCNHIWFFNKEVQIHNKKREIKEKEIFPIIQEKKNDELNIEHIDIEDRPIKTKKKEIFSKSKSKSNFNFRISHLLAYILVLIISFIALVLVVDTFKSPLFNMFPNLELAFYNLFETLKDISLFIKDLI